MGKPFKKPDMRLLSEDYNALQIIPHEKHDV